MFSNTQVIVTQTELQWPSTSLHHYHCQ